MHQRKTFVQDQQSNFFDRIAKMENILFLPPAAAMAFEPPAFTTWLFFEHFLSLLFLISNQGPSSSDKRWLGSHNLGLLPINVSISEWESALRISRHQISRSFLGKILAARTFCLEERAFYCFQGYAGMECYNIARELRVGWEPFYEFIRHHQNLRDSTSWSNHFYCCALAFEASLA